MTETFNTSEAIPINNYYFFSSPAQQHERGRPIGGLAIYIKPNLEPEKVTHNNNKIHIKTKFGKIMCYYYSPQTDISDIIQELSEDTLNIQDSCIIAGDFNCRIDTDNERGTTLTMFMNSQGFKLITTHIQSS